MSNVVNLSKNPAVSAVVFGKAGAGKSTIIGYLLDQFREDISAKLINEKVKREFPNDYDKSQFFAYVVDQNEDEILRGTQSHKFGTSKRPHFKRIDDFLSADDRADRIDLILIDTPGAVCAYRHRVQGMSFGEIGIFVVELSDVVRMSKEETNLNDHVYFFSPIKLWMSMKENSETLIVLSKSDLFSGDELSEALNCWDTLTSSISEIDLNLITTIVTMVDTESGRSKNLIDIDEKVSISDHAPLSLWSAIQLSGSASAKHRKSEIAEEAVVFAINKKLSIDGVGDVFEGKVLSGNIREGQSVRILPGKSGVKEFLDGHVGTVASIRQSDGARVGAAIKGDIVGISLRGRSSEYDLPRGAIVIDSGSKYASGAHFSITLDDATQAKRFEVGSERWIVWFGKVIWVTVLRVADFGRIALKVRGTNPLTMPLSRENGYLFEHIVLGTDRDVLESVNGRLIHLGEYERDHSEDLKLEKSGYITAIE